MMAILRIFSDEGVGRVMTKFILMIISMFVLQMNAYAFTKADIYEAIISLEQNDKRISQVTKITGTNNAWQMLFFARDDEGEAKRVATKLKYKGNNLYISQSLNYIDARVVDMVLKDSDAADKIAELTNFDGFMSNLTGFQSQVKYDGRRIQLEGHINISGKSIDNVKDIVLALREELAALYTELDAANIDALADYFEEVWDRDYANIDSAQSFVEIVGHGLNKDNQLKRRQSELGHWAWNIESIHLETINHGSKFEERLLLQTGSGLSQYKREKMYEDIKKRVKSHLPKGAKSVIVAPHWRNKGLTEVTFNYPLHKEPSGKKIREYHEKFDKFAAKVSPSLNKIVHKYTGSIVKQKIKSLTAKEFMRLMHDGLEMLPMSAEDGANGQWKFKYKGVAHIVTNYKKHMSLAFLLPLPHGRSVSDVIDDVGNIIEDNYVSFADSYHVGLYKGSQRRLLVEMILDYGVLSSSEVTGRKLKKKYHMFVNTLAPKLQEKIKR